MEGREKQYSNPVPQQSNHVTKHMIPFYRSRVADITFYHSGIVTEKNL